MTLENIINKAQKGDAIQFTTRLSHKEHIII